MAENDVATSLRAIADALAAGEALAPEQAQALRDYAAGAIPPPTLRIDFARPIEWSGNTYAGLDLVEPTGAQIMQVDKLSGWEGDIRLISIVSGMPEPAVKQVGARNLLRAARYIGAFLV